MALIRLSEAAITAASPDPQRFSCPVFIPEGVRCCRAAIVSAVADTPPCLSPYSVCVEVFAGDMWAGASWFWPSIPLRKLWMRVVPSRANRGLSELKWGTACLVFLVGEEWGGRQGGGVMDLWLKSWVEDKRWYRQGSDDRGGGFEQADSRRVGAGQEGRRA